MSSGAELPGIEPSGAINVADGTPRPGVPVSSGAAPTVPSGLYRANLWKAAVAVARRLPHFLLCRLSGHAGKLYWLFCPSRRRVVFKNVLPALYGDVHAARITTRELFQQFGIKLADLWRYESGLSIYNLFH